MPPSGTPEQSGEVASRPELSPCDELWRRVRKDYLAGDSAPVVAERYGLSERTIRRKAAEGGWRKADGDPPPLPDAPPWGVCYRRSKSDIIAENSEYEEIAAARQQDVFNLLFTPESEDLQGFAFRRACEAAAMDQPAKAAAWLRVQRMTIQCGAVPDPWRDAFSPDDHMRAALLRAECAAAPSQSGTTSGGAKS